MKFNRPKWTADVLINPNMGVTTFQRFAGDELFGKFQWSEYGPETFEHADDPPLPPGIAQPPADEFPESTISYCRWYWDALAPEQGRYDLDLIERAAASAAARGQTLDLRIMPHGAKDATTTVPEWYRAGAGPGMSATMKGGGEIWMPDYDAPAYLEHFGGLVRAAGERFDGDPRINMVDLAMFGHWGEWHRLDKKMGSLETRKKGVDLFLDAWPTPPKVMLIGGRDALKYAFERGCGWRADCWGDMGKVPAHNWCHMHDCYPIRLAEAEGEEAWKRAPVSLEVCWTMNRWHEQGWDVEYIIDQALRWHVTSVNLKSAPVPEDYWPHIRHLQRNMGYRIAPRTVRWSPEARVGDRFTLNTVWENQGVAPPYHGYPAVARLTPDAAAADSNQEPGRWEFEIAADTSDWLPGHKVLDREFELPADIPPGTYRLQLALLHPHSRVPCVRLACDLAQDGLWYEVGTIEITS